MSALCNFVLAVQVALLATVSSMEVFTLKQLNVKNGTDARLKCTFSSSEPVGDDLSVSWTFRPLSGGSEESVFYYHKDPFPPTEGRFKNRAVWDGSTARSDGSIIIKFVQPTDNGTFLCQVKNPPDVHGEMGETIFRVVNEVKVSELYILVLVIGIGGLVVIIIVLFVVVFRFYRYERTQSNAVTAMEMSRQRDSSSPSYGF